ncbi:amino acid permease [Peribacillus psychrosaccharolyticus]|uniref:Amino acid permease n=2 Tax=Peribacillus psychrosaccharolyticus TaxID=1407 RepID=A0A974RZA6_PERPY|nr:amino acid permease [Peribacillus psychrosaccharolyticus]MEC2055710.1 amino acid permease [Peribacillus psychrosaccharolyticus]MED3743263.1 amino acid permease [Peribacillus psychrosaccharolyticus]QQS99366.1 amino acid permease [Peribacillus psychrosaccharolyticus]
MGTEQLKKNIGFFVGTSLVVGTVIGSGIFMKPGIVLESSGDSTRALLAWLIGGLITLASGLTIAEVSTRIPKTGGLYAYLEEVYGRIWGFICGWVQTVIYGPAVMGALGLYFGSLLVSFFQLDSSLSTIVGIITVIFLGVVNSLGTRYGGIIQNVSTVAKLIPIFAIAIFGIILGDQPVLNVSSGSSTAAISMGAAILATLWAYDGWMNVGFMAGEMKDPSKTLPKAIITGILIVMVSYLSVNIAMLHVLTAEQIIELGPNAANTAATILFGDFGGKLITIGILISIFGCLNGKILTFPRIPFAMAQNGLLPGAKQISKVHKTYKTPMNATIMQMVIAVIMMIVSDPDRLTDMAIFSVFSFYGLAFFAVFILRKKQPDVKTYKVPFYPLTPIIAVIGTIYLVVNTVMDKPADALLSIGIGIIGLPLYWVLTKKKSRASN